MPSPPASQPLQQIALMAGTPHTVWTPHSGRTATKKDDEAHTLRACQIFASHLDPRAATTSQSRSLQLCSLHLRPEEAVHLRIVVGRRSWPVPTMAAIILEDRKTGPETGDVNPSYRGHLEPLSTTTWLVNNNSKMNGEMAHARFPLGCQCPNDRTPS